MTIIFTNSKTQIFGFSNYTNNCCKPQYTTPGLPTWSMWTYAMLQISAKEPTFAQQRSIRLFGRHKQLNLVQTCVLIFLNY